MQATITEHNENTEELEHKCSYTECQIDNSHHHQVFQVIYLVVSIFILTNGPEQFTPFAIFLFSSPVFVDLLFFKPTCKSNQIIKLLLLFLSGFYTLIYFLCAGNVITEFPEYFVVNKSNFLIGWLSVHPIPKQLISITLIPLILAPTISWIGSADKKISTISDVFRTFKTGKKI